MIKKDFFSRLSMKIQVSISKITSPFSLTFFIYFQLKKILNVDFHIIIFGYFVLPVYSIDQVLSEVVIDNK